jgi:hypothetical protein
MDVLGAEHQFFHLEIKLPEFCSGLVGEYVLALFCFFALVSKVIAAGPSVNSFSKLANFSSRSCAFCGCESRTFLVFNLGVRALSVCGRACAGVSVPLLHPHMVHCLTTQRKLRNLPTEASHNCLHFVCRAAKINSTAAQINCILVQPCSENKLISL